MTDQHGAYFEKPFLISVLNEIEDLDQDGIEDHYDLDDDEGWTDGRIGNPTGVGSTGSLRSCSYRNGIDSGLRASEDEQYRFAGEITS